tara:strand:- start:376 stop:618 length:243 start_codon:yes stop_codon:yes gene_type:complete
MNNQSLFKKYFMRCLDESNVAGPGGVFGADLQGGEGHGGSLTVSDWYAKGDARTPFALGAKKGKGKKKTPVIRRTKPGPM